LGSGELKVALTVQAHAFSKSAEEKIAAAGGKTELLK
jgi:large subunit ribosomal protein L15